MRSQYYKYEKRCHFSRSFGSVRARALSDGRSTLILRMHNSPLTLMHHKNMFKTYIYARSLRRCCCCCCCYCCIPALSSSSNRTLAGVKVAFSRLFYDLISLILINVYCSLIYIEIRARNVYSPLSISAPLRFLFRRSR